MNVTYLYRLVKSRRLPRWLVIIGAIVVSAPLLLVGFFAGLAAIAAWISGSDLQTAIITTLLCMVCYGIAGYCLKKAWGYSQGKGGIGGESNPAPWRARPEWKDGLIKDSAGFPWVLAFLTLVVNVAGWAFVVQMLVPFLEDGVEMDPKLLGAALPIAGLWLAGRLGYELLRRRKYGESAFEMDPFPGEIGGAVRGVITTGIKQDDAPDAGFALKLGCYRREVYYRRDRDQDGDEDREVRLDEVWSERQTAQPQIGAGGALSVPVDFHVPPGMEASTPTKRQERLLWRLDVEADVPGIDYEAHFEIPVFDASTGDTKRAQPAGRTDAPAEKAASAAALGGFAKSETSAGSSSGHRQRDRRRDRDSAARKPWTYRDEWADGRIEADKDMGTLAFLTLFALVWNAFSWPLAYFQFVGDGLGGEGNANLVVIFPIIGVIMASIAIYKGLRRYKYSDTVFEMDEVPGARGGSLRGVVTTGMKAADVPDEGFHVMISCFERRVSRDSDGDKNVHLDLYWRDEKRIQPRTTSSGELSQVPVYFELPDDQPASTPVLKPNRILWRLDVAANVPGVDYEAQMEIPVFDVPESVAPPQQEAAGDRNEVFWSMGGGKAADLQREEEAASAAPQNPYVDHEITERFTEPVSKGITMERTPGGGLAFYFGPARQKGVAFLLTLFAGGLGTLAWFTLTLESVLLGFFLAAFTALLAWGAFRFWTYTSTVRIENGEIAAREGPFGGGTPTVFPCADLDDVDVATSGASSGMLASGKAVYQIRLLRSGDKAQAQENNKKASAFMENLGTNVNERAQRKMKRAHEQAQHLVVGRGLKNHAEADWIAGQILEQAAEQERWR